MKFYIMLFFIMLLDHWKVKDAINNRKKYVNQIKHRVCFT